MLLRYVELESCSKAVEKLHLSGAWGGGSFLGDLPQYYPPVGSSSGRPRPKSWTIVAEKDSTCFFAHLGRLHAPQSQRNPNIVWELAFLNWKTKVIYIFLICMSFSFLLLALHALQTELEKKCSWGSVEEIISLERVVLWSQPSSIKHRKACAMPDYVSEPLSDESFVLQRTEVHAHRERSTVFIDCT